MGVVFLTPSLAMEAQGRMMDPLEDWRTFNDGRFAWSALTFRELKKVGFLAQLSELPLDGEVNVGHVRLLRRLRPARSLFLVSCMSDGMRLPWAHIHVAQNQLQVHGRDTFWMPHWPQVGLLSRSADRVGVKKVGYLGRLDEPLEFTKFRDRMTALGLEFVIRCQESWNDFSDVDVSISLRFLSRGRIRRKPPTKLINAWLAGVPFVAMDEPAYNQIATNGEDYIGVKTPDEVAQAVLRLRDDPGLYQRLVANGRLRAEEYGWKATTNRWLDLFEGPIQDRYELWKSRRKREAVRFWFLYGWWRVERAVGRLGSRTVRR